VVAGQVDGGSSMPVMDSLTDHVECVGMVARDVPLSAN